MLFYIISQHVNHEHIIRALNITNNILMCQNPSYMIGFIKGNINNTIVNDINKIIIHFSFSPHRNDSINGRNTVS